ncbi:MAG: hypothetical protein CK426_07295 [Legionella sp.]|nr:MAG: hypothetical protein CK423_04515 [Legionella sp.]PJD98026.1 MAG: hypothetical protein CK426_07295 [Legionella sp.]
MLKFFDFFARKKAEQSTVLSNLNPEMQSPLFAHSLDKKKIHHAYDFEQWYKKLEPYTFTSRIIAIDKETAIAFTHYYREVMIGHANTLTRQDRLIIAEMENTLASILEEDFHGKEVFIRMSNRSPKDGIAIRDLNTAGFQAYQDIVQKNTSLNEQLIGLTDLQMKNLNCRTTQEIFNLILTSERVYTDLLEAIRCSASEEDQWSTAIILREWEAELRQEHEFRLFVYQNKVTAISQYNTYCHYPSYNDTELQKKIVKRLKNFAEELSPLIKLDNYILDLALIGDRVIVIELNPFHPSTGACLFSWQTDESILKNRETDSMPILRVNDSPPQDQARWIELILNQQEEYLNNISNYPAYQSNINQSTAQNKAYRSR